MGTSRLEAFSDGVIAILITIMVLDLRLPAGPDLASLRMAAPTILLYLLSFVLLGIYWNNHHHMLQATDRISGAVLWANLHLLFWLSLVPYATRWMGESHFASLPTAAYGVVLILAAIAYTILQNRIIALQGRDSRLARAVGNDMKGYASLAAYALAIPAAFINPWISCGLYALVALIWLVPDPRIEHVLNGGVTPP
ncbi:MAG: TMEM175 family protein [Gemmatimonadales bacterium]